MIKKLSVRLSIVLSIMMIIITTLFTIYLVNNRATHSRQIIKEKGVAATQSGANSVKHVLENIVDSGLLTIQQVLNHSLTPIVLPESITTAYLKQIKKIPLSLTKFHYKTGLDSYLDSALSEIQDQYLADSQIMYAVLTDKHGYVPVHNSKYSKPLTGDFEKDLAINRSKRIFSDTVGLTAAINQASHLIQVYQRDTGETLWDISAPVYVKGHHWGCFRIGLSMAKIQNELRWLMIKLALMMASLVLVVIILIYILTEKMMQPLEHLHEGVLCIAKGDLEYKNKVESNDEIGDLAKAFNKMVRDLKKHIQNLQKTTAEKERIQSELKIAHDIQSNMLPKVFPPFPHRKEFDIFATMIPAKAVGGDFFDFFFIDQDRLCIVVGDVSGKGVPAALFMAVSKSLIKMIAMQGLSPKEILLKTNEILEPDNDACLFVTVLCGIYDTKTGSLKLANAGHNPALYMSNKHNSQFINFDKGHVLGVINDIEIGEKDIQLEVSDRIILYTDGVTECMDPNNKQYTEKRFQKVMTKWIARPIKDTVDLLIGQLQKWAKNRDQSDDITVVAFERKQ